MNKKKTNIDIKTKYEVSNELLQQLPQEFIELINKTPVDSDLFKRIVENS
jgi:hypothetical protein